MPIRYFEFRNVSKSFDENAVLRDVSFFVEQGETAVILGRSGVGKSVSLKLLLGFLQPDEGQIIVANEDVTAMGTADRDKGPHWQTVIEACLNPQSAQAPASHQP